MSYSSTSRFWSAPRDVAALIRRTLTWPLTFVQSCRLRQRRIDELNQLLTADPRLLRDIGVTRGDVMRALSRQHGLFLQDGLPQSGVRGPRR